MRRTHGWEATIAALEGLAKPHRQRQDRLRASGCLGTWDMHKGRLRATAAHATMPLMMLILSSDEALIAEFEESAAHRRAH